MTGRRRSSLTIEGVAVAVPEGTTILEAAKRAGVLIPHYCYHPGLPVAGVCRMCLVEVEKFPKLAPACATSVADGQVVHVHSPEGARGAQGRARVPAHQSSARLPDLRPGRRVRAAGLHLPGRARRLALPEPKRFNPVEDFGGDVLYVPNRCILCTRCVRFMDDVAEDPVLNVTERGDRAVIGDRSTHDLDHPWAGNVVDLCPVGALLSKDFLNKARAWELDRAASICPNCTQGCNITIETRDETVVRLRPRPNLDVNQYFMCDKGRLDYRWMKRRDRVELPCCAQGDRLAPVDWEVALRGCRGWCTTRRPWCCSPRPRVERVARVACSRLVEARTTSPR